ncbi:MAG: phosphatase PAP2 family protein [Candidatus Brennerbacteria bacterium]|nr:phosphatase PAP2 family protein [Candidatus Brennerbacteria bacterium]
MDTVVFNFFHSLARVSTIGDWLAIVAADYLPWALALAALALAFRTPPHLAGGRASIKKAEHVIFLTLAILVSRGLITEAVRYFVGRARPFITLQFEPLIEQSATSAFPSGHAAALFALAMAAWFINRKWGYWFFALALINGVARVIVGVHWPTDVLAGAVAGVVSALAVHLFLVKIPKQTSS